MNNRKMICIVCPLGCQVEISKGNNDKEYIVKGNQCKRGEEYCIKEMTNPTRILTTTVRLRNSHLKRLPVRTDKPIPKTLIFECMQQLNRIELCAPVSAGSVLISNILNSGANVISSRSIESI